MALHISFNTSPIADIRRRHGLTRGEAAARMQIPERLVAVMEMRTHGVPQDVLDAIDRMLSRTSYHQITLWEVLESMNGESVRGEGQGNG